MNTYVIPDLHGGYDKFVKLLITIDYDPQQDKLIFLGDYIDRGPESYKLVSTILTMYSLYPDNIYLLRGNHEQLAYDFVTKGEEFDFYNNGGKQTMYAYPTEEIFEEHIKFLGKLPVCLETEHFIFVHAGLKPEVDLQSNEIEDMLWIRDEFITYPNWYEDLGKTIVCGHTPVDSPQTLPNGVLMLDTGCGKGGLLSCLHLNSGKIIQV